MSDLIERLRDEPRLHEKSNGLNSVEMMVWHNTALEAAAEIERLRAELCTASNTIGMQSTQLKQANADIDFRERERIAIAKIRDKKYTKLRRELKQANADLSKYGDHEGDCMIGQEPYYKCDCGFLAALETK